MIISSGSTGQLYAQIIQGAPFDVFLAADVKRPAALVDKGLAGELITYAQGQLVMLVNTSFELNCETVLKHQGVKYLALANPDLAPYGLAAKQFLINHSWWQQVQDKLVMGENVSQAMHMVVSNNATAGLIAKALTISYELTETQCVQDISTELHEPINQGMVLLNHSTQLQAAKEFKQFLISAQAQQTIRSTGYLSPSSAQTESGDLF